jgi:leucyl-tRNA synthetase
MFMGPIESDKPWDTSAVSGVYRFLSRIYRLITEVVMVDQASQTHPDVARKLHQTIAQVGEQIPQLKFNTAIAALMELLNQIEAVQKTIGSKQDKNLITIDDAVIFIKLLAPFAPFITDELFAIMTNSSKEKTIHISSWPVFDEEVAAEMSVIIPVQINGKVRAQLEVTAAIATDAKEILKRAKELDKIQAWIDSKTVVKEIYVPRKIINLVIAS